MNMLRIPLARSLRLLAAAGMLGTTLGAGAQEDRFAGVEIQAHPVSGNVHMLTGAGGNIGVSVGADGTLIVDDQFAPLAERILDAVNELDGAAPKLILNTHFHGDHTGSNPFFGRTGTIVAHDNVRARLSEQDDFADSGLPVLTFAEEVRVHFNGDTIRVIHLPAGHTDGDSIVWFQQSNVVHLGDLLFNGVFPFIDIASGGSVGGVIENLQTVLELLPADVQIIPGHGPLAGPDDVRTTLEMIRETRSTVMDSLGRGMTLEEIVAAGLDPRWESWGSGFIDEERWIRILAAGAGTAG